MPVAWRQPVATTNQMLYASPLCRLPEFEKARPRLVRNRDGRGGSEYRQRESGDGYPLHALHRVPPPAGAAAAVCGSSVRFSTVTR
jgi:hypothetical protein